MGDYMLHGVTKDGCPDCNDPANVAKVGDGKCSECAGAGFVDGVTCSRCNGSTKCPTCDGTGEILV